MIIQHNMMSIGAARQLGINAKKQGKETERLSSGYRINRAADDAAGLSISEKMRAQIRGLNQASENIQDGISYVQVADGALAEVHGMLHRMSELSIQSLNDTNTQQDRQAIDNELQEIKKEIDRIFKTTEFNTRKIWDEEGNNPVPTGRVTKEYAVTDNGYMGSTDITEANKTYLPKQSSSDYGYYRIAADDDGLTLTWEDCSGKTWTSEKVEWADDWTGTHSVMLGNFLKNEGANAANGLNAAQFEELRRINNFKYTWNVNKAATKEQMIQALDGRSIVYRTVTPEYPDSLNDRKIAQNTLPNNVSFAVDIYYDALLKSGKSFDADDDGFITTANAANLLRDPADTGADTDKWIFEFTMRNVGTVTATSYTTSYWSNSGRDEYEGIWWDRVYYGQNRWVKSYIERNCGSGDWASIKRAMEGADPNFIDDCGDDGRIRVGFRITDTSGNQVGDMQMTITVKGNDTVASLQNELKKLSGLDIEAKDGTAGKSYSYVNDSNYGIKIDVPEVRYDYVLNIQSSDRPYDVIKIAYEGMNLATLKLDDCDVTTRDNANETLTKVSDALDKVSEQRSLFGAYQNRMEHAKANVDNMEENVQAAESRLRDADMAEVMQEYSLNRILVQAGQAVIAQANQTPQGVLDLLRL